MILKARHHWFLYPFFRWYGRRLIRKHFASILVENTVKDTGGAILLVQNHWSWWDGFFASYVNDTCFRRKFHFMMLEKQLKRHWYFQYVGGYSISPGSRAVIESLQYTVELLLNPNNLVLVFPQGVLVSQHNHTIQFQRGIEYILQRLPSSVQVVFCVTVVDYFASKKPNLYCFLRSFPQQGATVEEIQCAYQQFYDECLKRHILRSE